MNENIFKAQVAATLERAAKLIEHGWCRGAYESDGRYCAMGAITTAGCAVIGGTDYGYQGKVIDKAADVLCAHLTLRDKQFDRAYGSLEGWNDAQRDKRKVVRHMRTAAVNYVA